MTLENLTTTLTLSGTNISESHVVEYDTKRTAGGRIKRQVSGKRFSITEGVRVTTTQMATLIGMLEDDNEIYYTPTSATTGYFSSFTFPMEVDIGYAIQSRLHNGIYYVNLSITSVGYE